MTEQFGSETAVEQPTALIIPFPIRARLEAQAEVLEAAPLQATERLSTALSALSTALTEQQAAIGRWRAAMTDLAVCMRKLSGGLERMDQSGPRAS